MITKERLEELIKQGATIYEAKYHNINPVDFSKNKVRFITDKFLTLEPSFFEKYKCHKYFNRLFENKEEAEWELEFGNITRTETLKLPKWEEFENDKNVVTIYSKKHLIYHLLCYNNLSEYHITIEKVDAVDNDIMFEKPLTKENYIEACKLCKKLFLGEEV